MKVSQICFLYNFMLSDATSNILVNFSLIQFIFFFLNTKSFISRIIAPYSFFSPLQVFRRQLASISIDAYLINLIHPTNTIKELQHMMYM